MPHFPADINTFLPRVTVTAGPERVPGSVLALQIDDRRISKAAMAIVFKPNEADSI